MMSERNNLEGLRVCWLGGTRYTNPLNDTLDHKWRTIKTLGIDISIVAFAAGYRPRHFTQHARFYLMPELPASVLRYLEMVLIAPWILLWLIFRRGVRVIITQSPFEGAVGAFVKNLSRVFGKRVALVVESHADFEVNIFMQRRITFSGVYRRLMNMSARYALRHADSLRAVSSSARQQLEQWVPGKSIEQFMTWVDLEAFGHVEREKPLSQSWDLVYAGVLIPRKGVHTLLDAFAQVAADVPQSHLWLVGKAENLAYTEQLHRQVERLRLVERVTFVGAVQQRELAGYMSRARG
ncbi:MAG: glycosyltransferase, partial [Anaerolineae bacterium]|nr:glycosyltransferase [Anaerolineae bacterium]